MHENNNTSSCVLKELSVCASELILFLNLEVILKWEVTSTSM